MIPITLPLCPALEAGVDLTEFDKAVKEANDLYAAGDPNWAKALRRAYELQPSLPVEKCPRKRKCVTDEIEKERRSIERVW